MELLARLTDYQTKVPEEKPVLMHGVFHKVCTNHPGLSDKQQTISLLDDCQGRFKPVVIRAVEWEGGGRGGQKGLVMFKMLPKKKKLDIVKTQSHQAVFRPKHVAVIVF
jgi:hypothetical protein